MMGVNLTYEQAARMGINVFQGPRQPQSKFKAVPQTVDGHRFPSTAESTRYGWLKLREKIGEISKLELQPRFPIHSVNLESGAIIDVGCYVGDFAYIECGERVVEDVKGVKLPLYKFKKKLVEAEYGITIREIVVNNPDRLRHSKKR